VNMQAQRRTFGNQNMEVRKNTRHKKPNSSKQESFPVLDFVKHSIHPAVVSFFTEADTAYRNGNYPALIKLCGSTSAWKHEVKLAKGQERQGGCCGGGLVGSGLLRLGRERHRRAPRSRRRRRRRSPRR